MSEESWVVIRSRANRAATDVIEQLTAAGINAELVVRVPSEQAEDAERLLDTGDGEADPSTDLNLETIATFHGLEAEMQVATVQGLLEQNGISVVVEGAPGLPSLPFHVKVAAKLAASARDILARAEADGPAAADAEAGGN